MNIKRIDSARSITSVISQGSESDEVAKPADEILYKLENDPVSAPQRWKAMKNKLFALLETRNTKKNVLQ